MTTKSTPQTAHTPTPWRASDAEMRDASKAITADGTYPNSLHVACCMEMMYEGEREANQALIVRAVNHHEALVAVLRRLLDDVEGYGLKHPDAEDQSFEPESANAARAVLAQVEQTK